MVLGFWGVKPGILRKTQLNWLFKNRTRWLLYGFGLFRVKPGIFRKSQLNGFWDFQEFKVN